MEAMGRNMFHVLHLASARRWTVIINVLFLIYTCWEVVVIKTARNFPASALTRTVFKVILGK
jgi:hypothetical protein